jgi:hypothetical protein
MLSDKISKEPQLLTAHPNSVLSPCTKPRHISVSPSTHWMSQNLSIKRTLAHTRRGGFFFPARRTHTNSQFLGHKEYAQRSKKHTERHKPAKKPISKPESSHTTQQFSPFNLQSTNT